MDNGACRARGVLLYLLIYIYIFFLINIDLVDLERKIERLVGPWVVYA